MSKNKKINNIGIRWTKECSVVLPQHECFIAPIFGGSVNNGVADGAFTVNANNAPSNTNWNNGASPNLKDNIKEGENLFFYNVLLIPCSVVAKIMPKKVLASNRKDNVSKALRRTFMKTYNDLFRDIIKYDNIVEAIFKASKNKRHKKNVKSTLNNFVEIAEKLSEELKNKTWEPLPCHKTKEINDGIELKKRYIVCPAFVQEQVIHHAIMNVCEPLFRKKFYTYSCGSIKGRGADQARKYLKKSIFNPNNTKNIKYVAKLDIKKFFQNARPSLIFKEIRKTIRDKETLLLIAKVLRANKQIINGNVVKQGIPIGFYTSPIFANILLNPIDHYIKEVLHIKHYVRYMDDMILFSSNKRELKKACLKIEEMLSNLHLTLKQNWQVQKFNRITFIGYQYTRKNIRLKNKIFLKTIRMAKHIYKSSKITIHRCLQFLSYIGRFKNADTYMAFKNYISSIICIKELRERVSNYFKKRSIYQWSLN